MVTDQQNLLNLGSAANLAKINLNLDLVPESDWSDDDMLGYLAQLRDIILAHPDSFNAASQASAQYMASFDLNVLRQSNYLSDQTQDLHTLQYELQNNLMSAGNDLAKLGQGTLTLINHIGGTAANVGAAAEQSASSANWILPVMAIALLYVIITEPSRGIQLGASAAKTARGFLP